MARKVRKHLVVFSTSLAIFLSGIFIGLFINEVRQSDFAKRIEEMEIEMSNLQFISLVSQFNQNFTCHYLTNYLKELIPKLNKLRFEIISLEKEEKIYTEEYKQLDKQFTLTRLRYWFLLENIRKNCDANFTIVLFFYTTKDCFLCEQQGIITSIFEERFPHFFLVVPLRADSEISSVNILLQTFNITKFPALVFNGEKVYQEFVSKEKMQEILCELYNSTFEFC